ncbi:MAG: hypothetical protein ACR2OV_16820, partial [Hyphomicrobiaceae bacterium]
GRANFTTALADDPRIRDGMSGAAADRLLDPTVYTGLCAEMAREQAAQARQLAAELSSAADDKEG